MPPTKKRRKKAPKTRHCANCGQEVHGKLALVAADPQITFCCRCGLQLNDAGKCQNDLCPFFGVKPVCA